MLKLRVKFRIKDKLKYKEIPKQIQKYHQIRKNQARVELDGVTLEQEIQRKIKK